MPDHEPALPGAQEAGLTARIDLTTYRTGDLAERLAELFSAPEALRKMATSAFLVALLCYASYCLIIWRSQAPLAPWLIAHAYALATAIIFGLLAGVMRVIAAAMANIEAILQIILDITGKAAADYEQMQTGRMRLPSGGELLRQVYDEVALPAMEKAIARAFGFLGRPLLWIHRRTIGAALRHLVARVKTDQTAAHREQQLAAHVASGLASLARYSEMINAFTSSAAKVAGNIGRTVRWYVIPPMCAVFFVALALATAPILLLRYLPPG